jgi:hypothetical protein
VLKQIHPVHCHTKQVGALRWGVATALVAQTNQLASHTCEVPLPAEHPGRGGAPAEPPFLHVLHGGMWWSRMVTTTTLASASGSTHHLDDLHGSAARAVHGQQGWAAHLPLISTA